MQSFNVKSRNGQSSWTVRCSLSFGRDQSRLKNVKSGFSDSTPRPRPDLPHHDGWASSHCLPFLLSVWTFRQECFPAEVVTSHSIGQQVFRILGQNAMQIFRVRLEC